MLAAALLCLVASAAGDEGQDPRTFEGRAVRLERLPTSPRRALRAAHPLGDALELGGERYAVEHDGPGARIAARPGAAPGRRLRNGAVVELEASEERGGSRRALLFERRDGSWSWGSPEARLFDVDGFPLCVYDADADGEFDLLRDAWSLGVGGPLMPLGSLLVLDDVELHLEALARDGSTLRGGAVPLEGSPAQRAALRRLNRLRLGEGLGAVRLAPELSAGCSAHAEYLAANGWAGGPGGADQDPRAPGATRAGLAAARSAEVLAHTPEDAVDELWRGLEGRLLLADPSLALVGVSAPAAEIAVIDARSRSTRREGAAVSFAARVASPADGALERPLHHAARGSDTPVPGAEDMGPPLLLRLSSGAAGIEAYELELFEVSVGRKRVAVELLPRDPERPGLLGGLPRRPLDAESDYLAVHRLTLDGEPRTIEVRFRTRGEL